MILGGAVGYLIGMLAGKADVEEARRQFEQQRSEVQHSSVQIVRRERLLTARHSMHRSLMALEQRNFGIAEQLAREAGTLLVEVGAGEGYPELALALQSFRPRVSEEISAQRTGLLDLIVRFDALLERETRVQPGTK